MRCANHAWKTLFIPQNEVVPSRVPGAPGLASETWEISIAPQNEVIPSDQSEAAGAGGPAFHDVTRFRIGSGCPILNAQRLGWERRSLLPLWRWERLDMNLSFASEILHVAAIEQR